MMCINRHELTATLQSHIHKSKNEDISHRQSELSCHIFFLFFLHLVAVQFINSTLVYGSSFFRHSQKYSRDKTTSIILAHQQIDQFKSVVIQYELLGKGKFGLSKNPSCNNSAETVNTLPPPTPRPILIITQINVSVNALFALRFTC